MPLSRAVAALPALLLIVSCSKTDAPPPPPPKAQVQAPKPAAPAEPIEAQVDPALRDRLARQEAAAKMFDRKPEPPKPEIRAEPKVEPKPEPRAEPKVETRAEPKKLEAAKPAEPPKAAPAKASEPPKAAAASPKAPEPARPAEPKAEPKAPATPPPSLAAAAPTSAPASSAPPRIVSRVDPDFPREAVKAGVDNGTVRARMTLDGTGAVTRVEIVEASPRRVFDRAVVQALTQWRFNDGAPGRMVETEVAFRR